MLKVNLLPLDLQEKAKERFSVYWFGAFPVIVLLACIPFYFIKIQQIKKVEADIVQVDEQIAKYKGVDAELAAAKSENQLLDTKINFIKQKKKVQTFWLNALDRISGILPSDVWLTTVSLQPTGQTSIVGNTFSYKSVANFLRILQKTPFVSEVKMSSSSKNYGSAVTTDRVNFTFTFLYHEEEKKEEGTVTQTQ